jgi:hypothetical protein
VADFNKDFRPDVVVVGDGDDALGVKGERPWLILSQADGSYAVNALTAFRGAYSSGAAADLDRDGDVDLLLSGMTLQLDNDGSGVFVSNTAAISGFSTAAVTGGCEWRCLA